MDNNMPRKYEDQSPPHFKEATSLVMMVDRAFKRGKKWHVASSWMTTVHQPCHFWYDEENHQIIFHSNVAGRIRSNIEVNPKVSMETSELGNLLPSNVALEFSLQFRSVVIFGTARVVTNPDEARRLLYGLIAKYFPRMTAGKEYREITDKELRATSIYAIKIEAWSGKENWAERADQSDEWPH
jgi:nitroimidazol reductase NimA-like FMN-containing flavoprotein (pyridoxamine 5'-phosphate oxidase superfamily)